MKSDYMPRRISALGLSWLAANAVLVLIGDRCIAGTPYVGIVTGSEVKVRTGGSQNHFAFTSVRMGQRVIVDREANGWCRIYLPRWLPAYVHKDYVTAQGARGVVKAGELNVRVAPQKAHEVVGSLSGGSEVEILGTEGEWLKIVPPATVFAFVNQHYIQRDREISPAEVTRELAKLTSAPAAIPPAPAASGPSRAGQPERGGQVVPAAVGNFGGVRAGVGGGAGSTGGAGGSAAGSGNFGGAVGGFTTVALRRAADLLERVSALDPGERDYAPAKAAYSELAQSSEDRTEIAAAEDALKRIDVLEKNQSALVSARQSIAEVERKNQELDERARLARPARGARSQDSDPYLARGWLTGMGRYGGQSGTHRLMKGSQVLYFLQCEEAKDIPLDAYLNKRVGVKGIIKELEPRFGANLIVVSEITILADR